MFLLNDAMRQHNYYVDMMSSLSRTLYAGVTNDLERRVFEHQEGLAGLIHGPIPYKPAGLL